MINTVLCPLHALTGREKTGTRPLTENPAAPGLISKECQYVSPTHLKARAELEPEKSIIVSLSNRKSFVSARGSGQQDTVYEEHTMN